jgi:hypothetical protein
MMVVPVIVFAVTRPVSLISAIAVFKERQTTDDVKSAVDIGEFAGYFPVAENDCVVPTGIEYVGAETSIDSIA